VGQILVVDGGVRARSRDCDVMVGWENSAGPLLHFLGLGYIILGAGSGRIVCLLLGKGRADEKFFFLSLLLLFPALPSCQR
jgi:hypothetical protein